MPKIYYMTIPQMIDRGWTIVKDNKTDLPTTIRSAIPDWNELTWAQQTYYRGKYLFNENGVLEITLSELRSASEKVIRDFSRDLFLDKYVTPDGTLAGSNERLREILEQSRVDLECRSYDDTALVHIGPDGTAIYTNEVGWGRHAIGRRTKFTSSWMTFIPVTGKSAHPGFRKHRVGLVRSATDFNLLHRRH